MSRPPADDDAAFRRLREKLLRDIVNTRIYDFISETPLTPAVRLSALCKTPVLLKREDLQPVFSFKIRGAYHKMTRLPPHQLAAGVVAASAGNHAQGVALAAKTLGTRALIVMPRHTQRIKIAAVRAYGARVELCGEVFDDAYLRGREIAKSENMTFIPPFDDADIVAGNGTIAAEILRQHPKPLRAIFCAVGGGGLVSGVAAYVKALRPEIRVIGVEAEESASMLASLNAGRRLTLPSIGIFADAVAVKRPGRLNFQLTQRLVDEIITVDNDAICAAIKDIYDDTRVVVEPAGALAVAGVKKYVRKRPGKLPIAAVSCGANMNFDRLRFVAERAEIGEEREMLFAVTIPERPGSFKSFCALLGGRSITEFNYRLADSPKAHIFVGVEINNSAERRELIKKLRAARMPTLDLTGDEMSKTHIRHMVGGRARAENECLYRFEFPERPGALHAFLFGLGGHGGWNISLFHYRNHGGDIGRVLCGIQVPPPERPACEAFLRELGYPFWREDTNRAYRLFLS